MHIAISALPALVLEVHHIGTLVENYRMVSQGDLHSAIDVLVILGSNVPKEGHNQHMEMQGRDMQGNSAHLHMAGTSFSGA